MKLNENLMKNDNFLGKIGTSKAPLTLNLNSGYSVNPTYPPPT